MPTFPSYGGPGEGASHFGGGGLGTPAAVGPRIIPTTRARPGGAMTLDALMARQKEAAAAQQQALQTPQTTIPGGIGQMLTSYLQGRRQFQAEQEEQKGHQTISDVFSHMDPATGATPEQMSAIGQYDPELMIKLWSDRASRANQEHFVPLTQDEKVAQGLDPSKPYQRSTTTGKTDLIGGGGITIDTGTDPKMPDWAAKDAKFYAQGRRANMDLEDFDTELTSTPNAIAQFVTGSSYLNSPEYQKARVAGDSWIMSVLRPESGGVIGAEEMTGYRQTYLPQPGDNQATIEYKRQLRGQKTEEQAFGFKSVAPNTYKEIQDAVQKEQDARTAFKQPVPTPDNPKDLVAGKTYVDPDGQVAKYTGAVPDNMADPKNWVIIHGAPAPATGGQ